MHIIVTGGAGFIGSHVADTYIAAGHTVVVIDNLSTGQVAYVNPKARFVEADITNQEIITKIITTEKPDVINMHAAHIQVGYSVKNPQFDAQNNIFGLLNIMEAAIQAGSVKKVIFASTGGAMYGDQQIPYAETLREEPVSPYGVSKRSGELYLHYYHKVYGLPYVALRYSNVYGPRQNPHGESGVIAIFAELIAAGKQPTINGDGSHTRDYVFVTDVAAANLAALTGEVTGAYNIGTGITHSTLQVYEKVAEEFAVTESPIYGPERLGEQVASSLDYSKAKVQLDWRPTVDFDEGVKQVVAWYKSRPSNS